MARGGLYRAPNRNARTRKKIQARYLRTHQTNSEKLVWKLLRDSLWHFQRQKVIGGWIFDFWCAEEKLVIELDGSLHDYFLNEKKNRFLTSKGIAVWRIPSAKAFTQDFPDWFYTNLFRAVARLQSLEFS